MNWALAIFLIIDALIIGAVGVLAYQHGLAHFKPDKHDAEHPRPRPENGHLPPEIRQQMQEKARSNFETIIDKYAGQLQKDLRASEANLTARLDKLSADIINKETSRYKQELASLSQDISSTDKSTIADIKQQEAAMQSSLEQELTAEKDRRLAQLDAKIADAVTSFLLEALGHEADLGAQEKYLLAQLEAHKSEIVDGIKNGA